jgi:hypothetical protein
MNGIALIVVFFVLGVVWTWLSAIKRAEGRHWVWMLVGAIFWFGLAVLGIVVETYKATLSGALT